MGEFGRVRVGIEITNLLNSTRITNINAGKFTAPATFSQFDQLFFQPGRAVSGDITVHF